MIEYCNVKLEGGHELFDADMSSDGNWIAVVGSEVADLAISLGTEIRLPRCFRFPIVRLIDHERFLVIDSRAKSECDLNAYLISVASPSRPINFHAGDGIADVLVTTNYIICTYFDEGVFGDCPISAEGVSVFDFTGKFCFGYQSRLTCDAVDIADCYAACNDNGDAIAFCAYTGFPIVHWNLKSGSHIAAQLPDELHGVSAMSAFQGDIFLYSPYKSRNVLFHYKNGHYRQIGTEEGRLKTLRDGRFLRREPEGFSIIDCRNCV